MKYLINAVAWCHALLVHIFKYSRTTAARAQAVKEVVTGKKKTRSIKRNPYQNYKTGRNEPCPCGSGRKYKKCHGL